MAAAANDSSSPPDDVLPPPESVTLPGSSREGGPAVCIVTGLRDGFAGGVMGSVFGFAQGLWRKQGFKGSLKEAGSSAKMFALLSGVHTLVTCFLRRVRGKHDEINAGIAGCATGLALSVPGTPDAVLRSCVTFAAFSYVMERFGKPQAAVAGTLNHAITIEQQEQKESNFSFPVLPPFFLAPSYLDSLELSSRAKVLQYTTAHLS